MKTATLALKTWLAANTVTWRADLLTFTMLDGTICRWSTFDTPLAVAGNTFLAAGVSAPLVTRGRFSQSSNLTIDTLDIILTGGSGFLVNGKTLGRLAIDGYFNGARMQLDHLIMPTPGDASLGPIFGFFEGRVAGIQPEGPSVALRVQSELAALNLQLPRFTFRPSCSHAVYDPNCTLVKATFTNAATVSNNGPTTTSIPSTTAAVIAKANGFYELGVIKFTSGALSGLRRSVKTFTVSAGVGTIVPAMALPSAPAVSDAFSIYPGCDKKQATCVTKFNNLVNFRGFPHIPASEAAQ